MLLERVADIDVGELYRLETLCESIWATLLLGTLWGVHLGKHGGNQCWAAMLRNVAGIIDSDCIRQLDNDTHTQ